MTVTTRKSRRSSASVLPMWRVTIAAHDVPPRWHVPARTTLTGSPTAEMACRFAAQEAHRDAGVPPMRSLLRQTLPHVKATLIASDR